MQIRYEGGEWLSETTVDAAALRRVLAALTDHSLYAREDELSKGYFTLPDGCRVGVCGRLVTDGGQLRMTAAGSLCVRVCRAIPGCGEEALDLIVSGGGVRSALILSPPGMGKTTLLRELARRLSEKGYSVCLADERHELAACADGVPTLDVGPRTDVMDGGPKADVIIRLLRAASPQVIVADEIGAPEDARALAEASRCGVSVIASAHAGGFEDTLSRPMLREALAAGAFEVGILLGGEPGRIVDLGQYVHGEGWRALDDGALHDDGQCDVRLVHGGGRTASC